MGPKSLSLRVLKNDRYERTIDMFYKNFELGILHLSKGDYITIDQGQFEVIRKSYDYGHWLIYVKERTE